MQEDEINENVNENVNKLETPRICMDDIANFSLKLESFKAVLTRVFLQVNVSRLDQSKHQHTRRPPTS